MVGNGVVILSDVYNVNLIVMGLVLDIFKNLLIKGCRIVVLVDMLELGKDFLNMYV